MCVASTVGHRLPWPRLVVLFCFTDTKSLKDTNSCHWNLFGLQQSLVVYDVWQSAY